MAKAYEVDGLMFRVPRGKTPKGRPWFGFLMTWGHTLHQIGGSYRFNWYGQIMVGFHSWWVRPGYCNDFYDGPHPSISLGFIVISWEPWGGGEWIEWNSPDMPKKEGG